MIARDANALQAIVQTPIAEATALTRQSGATMNTQPISRRSLAAGLALAPVAGLPELAGAVSADDTVLSALAEDKRRRAVSNRAWDAASDASKALDAARQDIGVVTYKREEVYNLGRFEYLDRPARPLSDAESGETIALPKSGGTAQQLGAARPDPEYQAVGEAHRTGCATARATTARVSGSRICAEPAFSGLHWLACGANRRA